MMSPLGTLTLSMGSSFPFILNSTEKTIKFFIKRRYFVSLAEFYIILFFSDIENDKIAVRNLKDKYQNFSDPKDLTKGNYTFSLVVQNLSI